MPYAHLYWNPLLSSLFCCTGPLASSYATILMFWLLCLYIIVQHQLRYSWESACQCGRPEFDLWMAKIPWSSSCSVTKSCLSDSLPHHGLQRTRLPCPSPSLGVCPNSCPFIVWCHRTISSSVSPFSPCPQSFPSSVFSYESALPGGQSIGASALASVLLMNSGLMVDGLL